MKVGLIGARSRSAQAFLRFLASVAPHIETRAFVRGGPATGAHSSITVPEYGSINADRLSGCDTVVNFVGSASAGKAAELLRVNAELPARIAHEARLAGVKQFIQLSSLSVHGSARHITHRTPLSPVTAYGRAKLEAEVRLRAAAGDMVLTLLRIPTIYGRDRPSKISRLAAVIGFLPIFAAPSPLPRRSILSDENLARVLLHLIEFRTAGVVYAADPQPFRLDHFASLLPSHPRIVRLPAFCFAPLAALAPRVYGSLWQSAEIDATCMVQPKRWPLVPTAEGLRAAFSQGDAPVPT